MAYVDVEVLDESGRICPLCDKRIDFTFEGPGAFLGGYNSGKFNGYGRQDSVIHTMHVYAECGNNRVFVRAGKESGEMILKATMEGVAETEVRITSMECDGNALSKEAPQHLTPQYAKQAPVVTYGYEAIPKADAAKYVPLDKLYCKVLVNGQEPDTRGILSIVDHGAVVTYGYEAIPKADAAKYVPLDKLYCKVLVNGQEPDTRGILSIVDHGAIYSPILYILERMKSQKPQVFDYSYQDKVLTIHSGSHVVKAEVGRTHLLVNGEENLLNGQPYENAEGVFIVEINAVISYIEGVSAWYDDKINVFRIEW